MASRANFLHLTIWPWLTCDWPWKPLSNATDTLNICTKLRTNPSTTYIGVNWKRTAGRHTLKHLAFAVVSSMWKVKIVYMSCTVKSKVIVLQTWSRRLYDITYFMCMQSDGSRDNDLSLKIRPQMVRLKLYKLFHLFTQLKIAPFHI